MNITSNGAMRTVDIGAPLLPWTSKPWHVAQESVLITCRHLLDRFRAGRPADTSAADNLKTYAVCEAAYESAATGRAVVPRTWP
jgi:predicted dehydrogenase